MPNFSDAELFPFLEATARAAGREILEVYGTEFSVDTKDDESPLTEADRRANDVIVAALENEFPETPIISEETKALPFSERQAWTKLWLVDPLDGTKEFVKRNGEFTVNIALIENGTPVAGVVFQPTEDRLYLAQKGCGAWKVEGEGSEPTQISGNADYRTLDAVTVVASRSHLSEAVEKFVADLEEENRTVEFLSAGSSLKLCLVAEGGADVYPRLAPTMEWDTGAAHAIVSEAGKSVLNWETREPLEYNKEDLLNPWFIVE